MKELTLTVERIADSPEEAVEALAEVEMFRAHREMFDGGTARIAATRMTPTTCWRTYGGDVKVLQKYALRIVSQCVSSSGCESTFALIHTKVRNRLGCAKLHKLVYVHYNLKLRIQQMEEDRPEIELDACGILMEVTLFDSENPIMDWLNRSSSEYKPIVDKGVVPPKPSKVVINEVRLEKSSDVVLDKPINFWASKRKHPTYASKQKKKKGKKVVADGEEDIVRSDDDTDSPSNSLDYAEFQDSSSPEDDGGNDDDNDGPDGKGGVRGGEQYVQATESQSC